MPGELTKISGFTWGVSNAASPPPRKVLIAELEVCEAEDRDEKFPCIHKSGLIVLSSILSLVGDYAALCYVHISFHARASLVCLSMETGYPILGTVL